MFDRSKKSIKWRRLDNSAKIFPLASSKKYSSVYRLSVVLKEEITPELLEQAVEEALQKFESFRVRLRKGVFWYYFEYNPKKVPVEVENNYPCKYIDPYVNNNFLFKMTYFENKINIDIFHSLTDGNSAIHFFQEIVYSYIELSHPKEFEEERRKTRKVSYDTEDSYLKNYNKKLPNNSSSKKAYIIQGKKHPFHAIAVTHEIIDVPQLKERCRQEEVTITQYLTAALFFCIYHTNYKMHHGKRPIKICIPVNLKKYFKSETINNFFSYITLVGEKQKIDFGNFKNIIEFVKKEFTEKLEPKEIAKTMSANVKLGNNPFIRAIPLGLKKVFVRLSYIEIRKYTTTTFSNIGRVGIIANYKKYIDNFLFMIAPESVEKIKCSACSYEDKIIFTFTSILEDKSIEKQFYDFLKEQGIDVKIESNGVGNVIS